MKYRDVFTIPFACWFLHCVKAPVIFDQLGFVYEIKIPYLYVYRPDNRSPLTQALQSVDLQSL